MMSNESKLVEALQIFMNKSVLPCLPSDHSAVNEWKFLSGIMNGRPIDYNQLDFYLLMANKSSAPESEPALRKQVRSYGEVDSPARLRNPPAMTEQPSNNPKR